MKPSLPATIEIRSLIRTKVTVLADHTLLQQMLMNLCNNSGYAMMTEGGLLEVTLDFIIVESLVPIVADQQETILRSPKTGK